MKLPPPIIMALLKKLSDSNYGYDEVLKALFDNKYKLPNKMPPTYDFIEKYLPEYKTKHEYTLSFTV